MDKLKNTFAEKLRTYTDPSAAKEWFLENFERIQGALEDGWVRDFIFEPVKGVFKVQGLTPAHEIRAAITRVAVANAVLAGLPGKMGVGVFVSIALEAWMAYVIARRVGVNVNEPADIFKYFSLLAGVGATIIWMFKELLSILFSLFSVLPGLNPLIPAELVATNFVGVLFWIGFEVAAQKGSFGLPKRAFFRATKETKALYTFQWAILSTALSPKNLQIMGSRFVAWFRGDIPQDKAVIRGELFATAAMAHLLAGELDKLEGPIGIEFVGAIRDRFPDLADASIPEIADFMGQYDAEQLAGVINLVKGKLFERLVTKYENADGDDWRAEMHVDESYPGSDVIITNDETGQQLEVSLKASLDPGYIESAWQRYPDIVVMGPEELNDVFANHSGYMPSNVSHAEVLQVTEDNFDRLLSQVSSVDVAAGGVAAGTAIGLWPFVVAYLKGRIGNEQLTAVFERALGDAGKSLASRVSYALVLGPVFAWYLLARGVFGVVAAADKLPVRRLSYIGKIDELNVAGK